LNKSFINWAPSIKKYNIHTLMKKYLENKENVKLDVNSSLVKSCLEEFLPSWTTFFVYNQSNIGIEAKKAKMNVVNYKQVLDSFLPVVATWWLEKNYVILVWNSDTSTPIFVYLINRNVQLTKFELKKQLYEWIVKYTNKMEAKNNKAKGNGGQILCDDRLRQIVDMYKWVYN